MPCTIDDYVQQTGRIGRDGKSSHAILLVHKDSTKGKNMTTEVKAYSSSQSCLREQLMTYFGDTYLQVAPPQCCSNCHDKTNEEALPIIEPRFAITQQKVCRSEMTSTQLVDCRSKISALTDKHVNMQMYATHVSTQVYPQLIDNVMKSYMHINSPNDILKLGAYSRATAVEIFEILNEFSSCLDNIDSLCSNFASTAFTTDFTIDFSDTDDE